MTRLWGWIVGGLTIISLVGIPEYLNKWSLLASAVDWNFWLNSGAWLPWSIRAVIATVLVILVFNPELNIRLRNKLNPKWPDGTPMGYGYILSWELDKWKKKIKRSLGISYDD